MLKYRDGDAASFEVLYLRHKGGLYRYILRQCKSESVAEELYQDVWMNLIKSRERYEVKAKFTTLLYQMAHNRIIDQYRRQQNTPTDNTENESVAIEEISTRMQEQPEEKAELSAKTERLLQLVEQLPAEQRQVFVLKEEAGMSIAEIAETCNINLEAAKSRLRYAVNKLRKGLREYEQG